MSDPMTVSAAKAGVLGWLSGIATISVLGIPAGAFVAALVASALNNTAEIVPGTRIAQRLGRVVFDALVGGWLAMLVIKLPAFKGYGVAELGATIAASLLTLCVPWIRENAKGMASDAWRYVRNRWLGGKDDHS